MSLVSLRSKGATDSEAPGDQGYHQNWYAVALSSEVAAGALVGKDFLGTRVIVYRDEEGAPVVQSGYCPHLGADLSVGQLIEGRVRCAYHHWSFDKTGRCVHIPTGGKIPPGARIGRYPTAEAWGVIWAFNGEKPLYDVPGMPDVDPSELTYSTYVSEARPVEHWLPVSNGVDFQHLRALHGLQVEEPDTITYEDFGISYSLGEGPERRSGKITGTNTFASHIQAGPQELFFMASRTPIKPRLSAGVVVVAIRAPKPVSDAEQEQIRGKLDMLAAFIRKLQAEDAMVLDTMRFRQGVMVEADRHLAHFFKYVRAFPCAQPLEPC